MQLDYINLRASLGDVLTLREPFWIASSHHTSKPSAINAWRTVRPAALTLKSSKRQRTFELHKSTVRRQLFSALPYMGRSLYCDGPKHDEFLTYQETSELLVHAQRRLDGTQIGVSVLSGLDEDYDAFRLSCPSAVFFELNLKYAFRLTAEDSTSFFEARAKLFPAVLDEVTRFCRSLSQAVVFVKIPREMDWLPDTREQGQLLDCLASHGRAGVILTNSLKLDLQPFIASGRQFVLREGVVTGEYLFQNTMALIERYMGPCRDRAIPVIASGGMITETQILRALQLGAAAVQLCTTFDYYTRDFYRNLVAGLKARVYLQGLGSFAELSKRLPALGAAGISHEPFKYFDRFFLDEVQNHMKADVRSSNRMDVVAMSGYTLLAEWRSDLINRFSSNRHFRLFLSNPEGPTYEVVQRSWGLTSEDDLTARRSRVREAKKVYEEMWAMTHPTRRTTAAEAVREQLELDSIEAAEEVQAAQRQLAAATDSQDPVDRTRADDALNDAHKKAERTAVRKAAGPTDDDINRAEAKFSARFHNAVPFYSVYVFDDNAYVSPYPFTGPGKLESPVYVFVRGSDEYARLAAEVDGIESLVTQSAPPQRGETQREATAPQAPSE